MWAAARRRGPRDLVPPAGLLLQQRVRDPRPGRSGLGARRLAPSSTTSWRSAALVDTPARDLAADRAEEAIGGYTILNDWSARDLQREETTVRLGPAKGKDFATTFGPWLVTPDELADAAQGDRLRPGDDAPRSTARDEPRPLVRRAVLVRRDAGAGLGRRPAPARRPDRQGTVGSGCLLEVRTTTLGRYLEPGDEVSLAVERLGALRTPDRGAAAPG